MAAGLSLEPRHLDRFARAFDQEVARQRDPAFLADTVETDGELAVADIALETASALRGGGPWGQCFPEPSFDGVFAIKSARIVGERHLKLWLAVPHQNRSFDAIAFNHVEADQEPTLPGDAAHLVYRLDINEYQGERRLQLLIDHLLPPPAAAR